MDAGRVAVRPSGGTADRGTLQERGSRGASRTGASRRGAHACGRARCAGEDACSSLGEQSANAGAAIERDDMNHGQKAVTGSSASHNRPSRSTTVALVLLLAGAVLGSAVMLIALWWRIDEVTTPTAQAAASSPADRGAQTTR